LKRKWRNSHRVNNPDSSKQKTPLARGFFMPEDFNDFTTVIHLCIANSPELRISSGAHTQPEVNEPAKSSFPPEHQIHIS
jgi:hypothetical protein